MAALLFLIGAALFGIGLVRRALFSRLTRAEQALWGIVMGWTLITPVAYVVARLTGHLTVPSLWIVISGVWVGVVAFWWPRLDARRRAASGKNHWRHGDLLLIALLCLFALIYTPLFDSHMLKAGADGGLCSGGGSAAYDIPFHAALSTSFAYGRNFPPVYTPLPPAPLLYPCMPDFLTAILLVFGWDLHAALVATAVPLAVALTGIFYCFATRLSDLVLPVTRKWSGDRRAKAVSWSAGVATLLFSFNGGLGFVHFFGNGSDLDVNYTSNPSYGLDWPNVICDMLLPQRTSLFGLSLGLIIFSCFAIVWAERDNGGSKPGWPLFLFAGMTAGLLPWFHSHSYLAVVLASVVLWLLRPRRVWLAFWLPAAVIAAPQIFALSGHVAGPGFTRFLPGWRGHEQPYWILYWIRNFGLPGILFIPAWLASSRNGRWFYAPFMALLLVAFVVVLSPNDYDNLKLIYYWYAGTSVVVAAWLVRIGSAGVGWRLAAAAAVFASTLSGALTVVYERRSIKPVFSPAAVAAADFVKAKTDSHSLFLTGPNLNNPILSLAGRAVVRGPTSWLWSHGYPFAERDADVGAIYRARDDVMELLRYYRVDYAYLSDDEVRDLRADRDFFDRTFPSIYRNGGITIYDLRSLDVDSRVAYPPREFSSRVGVDPAVWFTEFPRIGYALYGCHKAMSGRRPRYSDFNHDLVQLGRNLYVGAPQWLATLEANKQALMTSWADRPESPQPTSESSLGRQDYDDAFVLIHYFAFFHRDPDERGFEFWRRTLERTRDYRGITRAFVESTEYRDRSW